MCTIEYIKSIPDDAFQRMSKRGIFCRTIKRDIEMFEYFKKISKYSGKEVSYELTADKFSLSYHMTKKIILKFQ